MAKCGKSDDFKKWKKDEMRCRKTRIWRKRLPREPFLTSIDRFSRISVYQSILYKIVIFFRSAGLKNIESVQDSGSPSIRFDSLRVTRDPSRTRPHGRENTKNVISTYDFSHIRFSQMFVAHWCAPH